MEAEVMVRDRATTLTPALSRKREREHSFSTPARRSSPLPRQWERGRG